MLCSFSLYEVGRMYVLSLVVKGGTLSGADTSDKVFLSPSEKPVEGSICNSVVVSLCEWHILRTGRWPHSKFRIFAHWLKSQLSFLFLGWGKIKHPGSAHHTLQQAQMPPVSKDVCAKKLAASPGLCLLSVFHICDTVFVLSRCLCEWNLNQPWSVILHWPLCFRAYIWIDSEWNWFP